MQNKLQELTEQLYNEGLAKGRQEGERILAEAKAEAAKTVEEAERQAESIVAQAEKNASDLKSKAEADIRMASAQALQATRKSIEDLIVAKATAQTPVSDPDFLKDIVKTVAEKFSASEGSDLALILPEAQKARLEPWVKAELTKALDAPLEVSFSKKLGGGFTIGPKDGSYYISFTDKTFNELIADYLRPVTRKLLFGE